MIKNFLFTLLALFALVGLLGGAKVLQIRDLIAAGASMVPPPMSVATQVVALQEWETSLNAVGSLEAVQGVIVSADIPGRVTAIQFEPGTHVQQGQVLVTQDISSEKTQLRAAEANVDLAFANLERAKELYAKRASSKSDLDTANARYKESVAQADTIRSNIAKKTIVAPFPGRLGIRLVSLGQDLSSGTAIVSLQNVDVMFANFYLPQQHISQLALGLIVRIESDAVPGRIFSGKITAISPEVDPATRNIRIQATFSNSDQNLLPGMFANVRVVLPQKQPVLAIPATAVAYATFGDSVFIVEPGKDEAGHASGAVARQQFVRLGRSLGDFVSVEKGLKEGQEVIVAGVFKLQNGAPISVNNEVKPDFSLNPTPQDQ